MIVHRYGQFVAALGAAPLQNILAVRSPHAMTETVHAQAAMNFWLISPLRHYTFLSKSRSYRSN
jgi:hypothetical protein